MLQLARTNLARVHHFSPQGNPEQNFKQKMCSARIYISKERGIISSFVVYLIPGGPRVLDGKRFTVTAGMSLVFRIVAFTPMLPRKIPIDKVPSAKISSRTDFTRAAETENSARHM